ncbi:hypothetical protein M885DRAFT_613069, partial [Pelagophyceae sp. CCMP2097]
RLFAALLAFAAVDVVNSLDVARATSARATALQPSRRALLQAAPFAAFAVSPRRTVAADAAALDRARAARLALDAVPPLLEAQEWDKARSVLKASPVAELWNLGNAKNYVRTAFLDAGDADLIELAEDLSSALQLTDQYAYDNNFIYFQPGNGKVKVKEPIDQANIAKKTLTAIVQALEAANSRL